MIDQLQSLYFIIPIKHNMIEYRLAVILFHLLIIEIINREYYEGIDICY